ncbi:hypothetical protein C7M84_010410 [Penaeus vannamei]|uniref:Uncharacterized protein n=1 Tax=Penaeus vannamei TaxID=6689 RepID=A0A3R7MA94_PENVA|nr:hypothetical protein C7M84_010410 [Penaeus vannamei]
MNDLGYAFGRRQRTTWDYGAPSPTNRSLWGGEITFAVATTTWDYVRRRQRTTWDSVRRRTNELRHDDLGLTCAVANETTCWITVRRRQRTTLGLRAPSPIERPWITFAVANERPGITCAVANERPGITCAVATIERLGLRAPSPMNDLGLRAPVANETGLGLRGAVANRTTCGLRAPSPMTTWDSRAPCLAVAKAKSGQLARTGRGHHPRGLSTLINWRRFGVPACIKNLISCLLRRFSFPSLLLLSCPPCHRSYSSSLLSFSCPHFPFLSFLFLPSFLSSHSFPHFLCLLSSPPSRVSTFPLLLPLFSLVVTLPFLFSPLSSRVHSVRSFLLLSLLVSHFPSSLPLFSPSRCHFPSSSFSFLFLPSRVHYPSPSLLLLSCSHFPFSFLPSSPSPFVSTLPFLRFSPSPLAPLPAFGLAPWPYARPPAHFVYPGHLRRTLVHSFYPVSYLPILTPGPLCPPGSGCDLSPLPSSLAAKRNSAEPMLGLSPIQPPEPRPTSWRPRHPR